MEPVVGIALQPTSGTIDGVRNTQTPSRAEHGPGGVLRLKEDGKTFSHRRSGL